MKNIAYMSGCLFLYLNANATDLSEVVVPSQIEDQKLSIGRRELVLPSGDWTIISLREGNTLRGNERSGTTYHAYAVKTENNKWVAAVTFWANKNSIAGTRAWKSEPCINETAIFKESFNEGYAYPDCVEVLSMRGHLINPTGDFYINAQKWLKANGIEMPKAVYQVSYSKFDGGDFGVVTVFFPKNKTVGDEGVIAWAKSLQPRLQRMLGNRERQAQLPELPILD
jgi:hypothetical protein